MQVDGGGGDRPEGIARSLTRRVNLVLSRTFSIHHRILSQDEHLGKVRVPRGLSAVLPNNSPGGMRPSEIEVGDLGERGKGVLHN